MTAAARPRAPISLQLVGLLLASLLAAQAISFAIILFMPPPRPPVYHLDEVATALRGGSLKARSGRPMTRQVLATLPADLRDAAPPIDGPVAQGGRDWSGRALAEALDTPAARIRLIQSNPSPIWRLVRQIRQRGEADIGGPSFDRGPPPFDPARAGPFQFSRPGGPGGGAFPGPDRRPPRWRMTRGGGGPSIIGDFAAAAQQESGAWVVVRASPEPFPNSWQIRTSLWLLAGFLIVAPAGYLFARRISAPLGRFAQAAEALGRDPHAPPMNLTGPAEVGQAADAFNEMQARLKRYIDDRTAMVGAISHDLRTPLARIKFKLETAPPAMRDSVLSDVEQMEHMIGGVLAFIRNEGQPRRRERLDLLSLVECVADDCALLGASAEVVEGAPVTVDGDPVALQRLFGNLVDNAVKYGGEARIKVLREGDCARVEIADSGPGLSVAELTSVFQPFYRADASRNLDKGGVGLGLPIARSAARAHGGDVDLISGPSGSTAIVRLPTAV